MGYQYRNTRSAQLTMYSYRNLKRLSKLQGVNVSRDWKTFDDFVADMGLKNENMTLQRRDKSKGYTKTNCYWAVR